MPITNEVCTVDMVLPAYGGDLLVANARRVSYDRWHDELTERDRELIAQFAAEDDTSTFYHSVATFRITCPLPALRQLTRHNPGFSPVNQPNEVSRRYTSRNIVVHSPEVWRSAHELTDDEQSGVARIYDDAVEWAILTYEKMLDLGVAREQARFVLPQGMMATVLWTGNLYAWRTLVIKRTDPRAQSETQEVARRIAEHMAAAFPLSWPALMEAE